MRALYTFAARPIGATPGVGNYAFLPAFGLPLQSVGGTGNPYYSQYGFLPAGLYYGQDQRIDGLAGVNAPGFRETPLIDMAEYVAELNALESASRGVQPIGKE